MLDNLGLSACIISKYPNDDLLCNEDYIYSGYRTILERKEENDLCWQNFLSAIVLWDKIYINKAHTDSRSMILADVLKGILEKHFADNCKLNEIIETKFFLPDEAMYELSGHTKLQYHNDLNDFQIYKKRELIRVTSYLDVANANGYDFLPHPSRAKVLQENNLFNSKNNLTEKYIQSLEKNIQDFLEHMNDLYEHQLKKVDFPILYSFIRSNANEPTDELNIALELRNNKNVIKFRKSIDKMNKCLNSGDKLAYINSLKDVSAITETISHELNKKPISYEVKLGLSPTLEYPYVLPNAEMSVSGTIYKRSKSKIHTTFLYDLANFSLRGKTKKKYFK